MTKPELQSVHGLRRIWFDVGATEQYYPFLHTTFWLEHRLWGDAPMGYHLANILLHAGGACLLAAVLQRLAVPGARLAAFIFALHPVFVESVAWVSEQKNTLSIVFYLAAALAYLDFDETRRGRSYLLASALFILAVLSKSVTATLPAALLVVFWWRRGRLSWRSDVLPLLPWFMLGGAIGLFTGWVERTFIGAKGAAFDLNFLQRCLLAGRMIWFYLGKLLWPAHLIFIYPRWEVNAHLLWQYVFPLAVIALVAALALIRHRTRAPLAALLFFIGSLFPTLGFFNVYAFIFSYVADHWQYLPSLGIIVLFSAGIAGTLGRMSFPARAAGWALVAALVGLLGVLTSRQSRMYNDMETFYRTTLDKNPACWMAHNNLGLLLAQNRQLPEAINQFGEALRLNPGYMLAHVNLGGAFLNERRFDEAATEYEEALRIRPDSSDVHYYLGNARLQQGRVDEAMREYREALRIDPNFTDVHVNYGNVLAQQGRSLEAIREYEAALTLEPDAADVHYNLGCLLVDERRLSEARAEFETALRLQPDYAAAREGLAQLKAGRP